MAKSRVKLRAYLPKMLNYKCGKNQHWPQIVVILISSLGGISYGMLFSWTSPGILELVNDKSKNISLEEASYFTIIPQITMILSAPVYAILMNRIGRQRTAALLGIPHLLSWITTGLAQNVYTFYFARFLAGIGDSGLFTVLPVYICEISEPAVRGTWGNCLIIFIAVGKFLVIAIGAYSSITITAICGGCITATYIFLSLFLPESPYYLLMNNHENAARKSLTILRWRSDTDDELKALQTDVARQVSETGTYGDLFKVDSNRRALIIAVVVRCAQQFSGLTAFELYTQYMFQQAGTDISDKMSAIIFSFTYIPALCVFASVCDKFGRRRLTVFSCISCAVVLGIETIFFGLQRFSGINLDAFSWVPIVGLIMYVLASSTGLVLMPVLLQGELFSASIKAKATGVISIVLGVNSLIVPKLFQTLTYNFGIFTPFAVFTCCTCVSSLLCYWLVIETKGKTLEQIQQSLKTARR